MDHEAFWQAMLQPGDGLPRIAGRPSWHARAACRGVGTSVFFPTSKRDPDESWRALCDRCEVRAECAADAIADPKLEGNWAGMTQTERRRLRRSSTAA